MKLIAWIFIALSSLAAFSQATPAKLEPVEHTFVIHNFHTESGVTLPEMCIRDRNQPSQLISGSSFLERVGPENVLPHVQAALARAKEIQGNFDGLGREVASDMEHLPL